MTGKTSTPESGTSTAAPASGKSGDDSALASDLGKTVIADQVVAKIAGIATRDVDGVHSLGGGMSRTVGAIKERIPGSRTNYGQGVSVEVGERQAAVDLDIIADYGIAIADLAAGVRRNVVAAVERMTGLEVTEVNIVVHDVHLEGESGDESEGEARVQ